MIESVKILKLLENKLKINLNGEKWAEKGTKEECFRAKNIFKCFNM